MRLQIASTRPVDQRPTYGSQYIQTYVQDRWKDWERAWGLAMQQEQWRQRTTLQKMQMVQQERQMIFRQLQNLDNLEQRSAIANAQAARSYDIADQRAVNEGHRVSSQEQQRNARLNASLETRKGIADANRQTRVEIANADRVARVEMSNANRMLRAQGTGTSGRSSALSGAGVPSGFAANVRSVMQRAGGDPAMAAEMLDNLMNSMDAPLGAGQREAVFKEAMVTMLENNVDTQVGQLIKNAAERGIPLTQEQVNQAQEVIRDRETTKAFEDLSQRSPEYARYLTEGIQDPTVQPITTTATQTRAGVTTTPSVDTEGVTTPGTLYQPQAVDRTADASVDFGPTRQALLDRLGQLESPDDEPVDVWDTARGTYSRKVLGIEPGLEGDANRRRPAVRQPSTDAELLDEVLQEPAGQLQEPTPVAPRRGPGALAEPQQGVTPSAPARQAVAPSEGVQPSVDIERIQLGDRRELFDDLSILDELDELDVDLDPRGTRHNDDFSPMEFEEGEFFSEDEPAPEDIQFVDGVQQDVPDIEVVGEQELTGPEKVPVNVRTRPSSKQLSNLPVEDRRQAQALSAMTNVQNMLAGSNFDKELDKLYRTKPAKFTAQLIEAWDQKGVTDYPYESIEREIRRKYEPGTEDYQIAFEAMLLWTYLHHSGR